MSSDERVPSRLTVTYVSAVGVCAPIAWLWVESGASNWTAKLHESWYVLFGMILSAICLGAWCTFACRSLFLRLWMLVMTAACFVCLWRLIIAFAEARQ